MINKSIQRLEGIDLPDTIELMVSDNYTDRFKSEYYQTKIRAQELEIILYKYTNGSLDFTPNCPYSILKKQLEVMDDYLTVLEARAAIEGIDIPELSN